MQSLVAAVASLTPLLRLRAERPPGRFAAFLHGVASGDPTTDSVILWTRVSGYPAHARAVKVRWQVAEDRAMSRIVAEGVAETGADRDFTLKVDASGLPTGRTLHYRFDVGGLVSPVGRTRTLPDGAVDSVRFAVTSCSNYPSGYFHAYREIAKRDDVDAVLHLGDYIYEYGPGSYATEHAEALGRVPEPPGECVSLLDYRLRHAQYKRDPDSQAMHAAHPLIAIWDDHEIANDTWRDGAQNHQAEEGSWPGRRDAAVRAWFEWMPVRGEANGAATPTYRDFRFGDLAHLLMLDARLIGRDRQPNVGDAVTPETIRAALRDPARRMLGGAQEQWLRERLQQGGDTVWQVIGQQVKVAEMLSPDLAPLVDPDGPSFFSREQLAEIIADSKDHPPSLLDTWDGYPAARHALLEDLSQLARNPLILSGDMHTAMAAELLLPDAGLPVAVEFMAPSVTSPGITAALPEKSPGVLQEATLEQNPHMKYMEMHRRGWLCLTLTPERCSGEWHLLDGIREPGYESMIARTLWVETGRIGEGLRRG
jgi:alkaline phosphatase D